MTSPQKILVLGGGLSGLLAAWHLQRGGCEVEVWEAASDAGGWAQTLSWPGPAGERGFLERGPQSLRVARGGALERLLGALDLAERPSSPKGPRWLGMGGRRHPSPATLEGLLRAPGLSLGGRLRLLAEPFIPSGGSPEETLQAFFARRLGRGFAEAWLPALTAGVLAAPPERIGIDTLPRLRRLEEQGGLLRGGLRAWERTCLPVGGTGALARSLAARLGCVTTNRPAQKLEQLPGGRWRVTSDGLIKEVDALVLALPPPRVAQLLRPLVPAAADQLAAIPQLDLRIWHSRHPAVRGWERGFGLLIHPPEGRGLLGVVALAAEDPRGVPGLLQLRTYLGGAYPVEAELETWPGVYQDLRRWLPELGEPVQTRQETCPGAFPLLEPGHSERMKHLLATLPPNLHWLGASRFGPGVPDLAESVEAWAGSCCVDQRATTSDKKDFLTADDADRRR